MINKYVKTSYKPEDVVTLLQDVQGVVPILGTKEREQKIQNGVHYSEMLPLEYEPTDAYMKIYKQVFEEGCKNTARAVKTLVSKIMLQNEQIGVTLVSLARAGTPVGIILKKYIENEYKIDVPHYAVSIVRGKGIDTVAMDIICEKHDSESIVFIDGWVGKGAIQRQLYNAIFEYNREKGTRIDATLGVLSDPAMVTELYGTREDFLIPSACLNATISGLMSRTVQLKDSAGLHGAVYYGDLEAVDQTYTFIDRVCDYLKKGVEPYDSSVGGFDGLTEVKNICKTYGIEDINKVKPGIGETTRVLLRRVPDRILIHPDAKGVEHILQLAEEKGVVVENYPLQGYCVCGIIKDMADC